MYVHVIQARSQGGCVGCKRTFPQKTKSAFEMAILTTCGACYGAQKIHSVITHLHATVPYCVHNNLLHTQKISLLHYCKSQTNLTGWYAIS